GDGGRFQLLAAGNQLAHVGDFFRVTLDAGLALFQGARAAVFGAFGDPFRGRDARIEQGDFGGGHGAPVGRGGSLGGAGGQDERGAHSAAKQGFFHTGVPFFQ